MPDGGASPNHHHASNDAPTISNRIDTDTTTASRSPNTARPDTDTSTPVTATAPAMATPMPIHTRRCTGARDTNAAHTGCVDTSVTADATDVYDRLEIHVAKWAASTTPAPT